MKVKNMLTTAVNQMKVIADGWKNVIIKNQFAEELAQQRGEVCLQCEHKTPATCGLCGCPLVAKQRALDATCPDGRW